FAYGSFAPKKHGTKMVASFYRMAPNESLQIVGIMHLLKPYGWTWVGLLIMDDDSGDNFLRALDPLPSENRICSAFVFPYSVCNDPCPAGYQKKKKEGQKFCCYDGDPCSEGKMSNMSEKMLRVMVILWLLVDMKFQIDASSCSRSNLFPILHEWYQPGNLLIGGITAQIVYVLEEHFFEEHPSQKSFMPP
ncbi:hypothetical protein E2320_003570, partial [Naja naja]